MNCIILISSPGAGKGTVSQYIKDNYNIDHISTGNLLRKKSETSKEIKDVLDKGLFVDDNTLINVLEEGADKLTLADMNEESANMLALQTRQQLAINSLSLASQAAQSVLALF